MSKLKGYRKFLAATAVTAVIASTSVVPFQALNVKAASFTDIVKGAFYYEAVVNLAGKGPSRGLKMERLDRRKTPLVGRQRL